MDMSGHPEQTTSGRCVPWPSDVGFSTVIVAHNRFKCGQNTCSETGGFKPVSSPWLKSDPANKAIKAGAGLTFSLVLTESGKGSFWFPELVKHCDQSCATSVMQSIRLEVGTKASWEMDELASIS